MPRILRSYLISFAIIGGILLLVHFWDEHVKKPVDPSVTPPSPAAAVHP